MPQKTRSLWLECAAALCCLVVLFWQLRAMLFLGLTGMVHDNLYTELTSFHFFAESLLNGTLPFWDPYSFAGMPFYPQLLQGRHLDPVHVGTVLVGQFFSRDTVTLFHWTRLIETLIALTGVYALLRPLSRETLVRAALSPILLFSFFLWGSFRQPGLIHQFAWLPWTMFFARRIFLDRDHRWHNWILIGVTIGLKWQSYFFSATWVWLFFFFMALALFDRSAFRDVRKKVPITFFIVIAMMAPDLVVYLEQNRFVFPLRMVATSPQDNAPPLTGIPIEGEPRNIAPLVPSYEIAARAGLHGQPWQIVQWFSPSEALKIGGQPIAEWRFYQDVDAYFGLLTWAIALLGMFVGRHRDKKIWLALFFAWGLLFLGPTGRLYPLLHAFFPPVRMSRHTAYYLLPLLVTVLYFFVLGASSLMTSWRERKPFWRETPLRSSLWLIVLLAHAVLLFNVVPNRFALLAGLLPMVVLPFLAYALLFRVKRAGAFVAVGWLALLTWDLHGALREAAPLYQHHPRPSRLHAIDTHVRAPVLPNHRELYPKHRRFPAKAQAIRGFSLLTRKPTAFAPLFERDSDSFEEVLRGPRCNSFYLPASYYTLLHSGVEPGRLRKWLAIGEDVFQFSPEAPLAAIAGEFRYEVDEYRHGDIRLLTHSQRAGWLSWAEGYDPYWQARLDGKPLSLYRANGHFKAVELPPGLHDLHFVYRPWPFLLAITVFYATFLVAVVAAAYLCMLEAFRRVLERLLSLPHPLFAPHRV